MFTRSNQYLYAGARIKSLTTELLTESQVDRLMAAANWQQSYEALQDTFLGAYLVDINPADLASDLSFLYQALESVMAETKDLLVTIAPEPELLDLLWLKYDWHNLKVYLLGQRQEKTQDQIQQLTFDIGKFKTAQLIKAYDANQLRWLNHHLATAAFEASLVSDTEQVGIIFNYHYFEALKELRDKINHPVISQLIQLMIDLFNLKTGLRQLTYRPTDQPRVFVAGGTFSLNDLKTTEDILAGFNRLPSSAKWQKAINDYQVTGHLTAIKRSAEEQIMDFLRQNSLDYFNPAALLAYFAAKKNNVQIINIIMTGQQAGATEMDIRTTLRQLYRTI